MSKAALPKRSLTDIMSDMLAFTHEMISQKDDYDVVMGIIEKRSLLIDEFDALRKKVPDGEFDRVTPEIRRMANEMLEMDVEVGKTLESMKEGAKQDLKDSTQQNKILNYANKAVSSSGSYIDFKE